MEIECLNLKVSADPKCTIMSYEKVSSDALLQHSLVRTAETRNAIDTILSLAQLMKMMRF